MTRKLAVAVLGVAMLGVAGGQTPPPIEVPAFTPPASPPPSHVPVVQQPVPSIPAPIVDGGSVGIIPIPKPETPTPPPVSAPPTFDTLVKELQAVRVQKAELEKQEKAITEALLKKFAEQKSQLDALGIPASPPPPVPAVKEDAPVPSLNPERK